MTKGQQEGNTTPVYTVVVDGVVIKQFKSRERANEYKEALEDEPFLFIKTRERSAENWMLPYIKFDEDEE